MFAWDYFHISARLHSVHLLLSHFFLLSLYPPLSLSLLLFFFHISISSHHFVQRNHFFVKVSFVTRQQGRCVWLQCVLQFTASVCTCLWMCLWVSAHKLRLLRVWVHASVHECAHMKTLSVGLNVDCYDLCCLIGSPAERWKTSCASHDCRGNSD